MQRDLSRAALEGHLARLKLKRLADSLDTILDEAQRAGMSPMETLAHALGDIHLEGVTLLACG